MNIAVDRKLVGRTVYESLRNDIVTGRLEPGYKLKLNELKERYSASINTLRETLMRLVSDGFVKFEDQKGFRVNPVSKRDLEELVDLRVMLETRGLRQSMADKDRLMDWKSGLLSSHYRLTCMEQLMMEDEAANVEEWELADRSFHLALVANCGSRQLIRYHASIIELFMRYQVLALEKRPFRGQASIDDHQALLDLIMKDDVEGAVDLLTHHIVAGRELPL
ncbi:GntR family transcriptional regulator [Marinobacter sp. JSM 1782161]|uniref:GntR family transcriptional regulator n=1 Tax=Marinobacter sp. JSM 1782161 TaxID=2685906 RepID=UPI0014020BEC|nr:GntR family transcriptional regulator [Marinobacter sp. JSM 1782161]